MTPLRVYLPRISPHSDVVASWTTLLEAGGIESAARCEEADLTLFVECHLLGDNPLLPAVRAHPAWTRTPQQCFVYDERDEPLGHLPGAYVSLPQNLHRSHHLAVAYYATGTQIEAADSRRPRWLYSFMGSRSHPARTTIFDLVDDRAQIEDTSGFIFFDDTQSDFIHRKRAFADLLADTKFVLCPRGRGTSSIRMYECLKSGRVPVIIADDWVPPPGIPWEQVSLRVPESNISDLPEMLRNAEPRFPAMAAAAAEVYRNLIAPARAVPRLVLDLAGMTPTPTGATSIRSSDVSALARWRLDRARAVATQTAKRGLGYVRPMAGRET